MTSRLHVVVGSPWMDAVIRHLQPRAPYRPWLYDADVRENDDVVVVFDTEPALMLTQLACVGSDLDVDTAIVRLHREWVFNNAVPVTQLGVGVAVSPTVLEGADAVTLKAAVEAQRFAADDEDRFGTSSLAAARALLESAGHCTGCRAVLPLASVDARESFGVWTVEAEADDWPAVLCGACRTAVRAGSFNSFLDFKYFLHPACPRCGRRRSKLVAFGMPVTSSQPPPWIDHRGCCVTDVEWVCARCRHEW
ncbi:hypothetical protein [Mycolicibacterium mengxianglii]|uniref:hypothetical protein n=1 Tax=Mycolicibacterium mengxianglii TaxID=2736649 RepID=UPI0018D07C11|nr:hypothetical protein [Mycolicibacterium mengxianglii]